MCKRNASILATSPRCLRCPKPCCGSCGSCVSYCIFDLESAVFDTRHIYERACRELLASYDKVLPEPVLMRSSVMQTLEMAQLICRKCDLSLPWEAFLLQLNEHACSLIANPPLMEGVERLIHHLHDNCIGLALISSSKRSLYCKKILGREKFFKLFDVVLCADDYNQPKPQPDCYLLAMSQFDEKPPPECCLAFDGTVRGVQAARDAHLQVIMLPDLELPCYWSEMATQRLETLLDFDPEDFGMPYLEPLPDSVESLTRVTKELIETLQAEHMEEEEGDANQEADEPAEEATVEQL